MLVCGALSAIAPFSIDMYLPGFPFIARNLQSDIAHVTLSLTSFFLGISFGQMLYGPLLDRFGRKKPLLFGLVLYTIASVGCGLATSVDWLIALRLLQALGGCVGMVATRAVLRDLFPANEIARALSQLLLIMGIAPIVAPTIGGFVVAAFGWRAIFAVLTVFGVLLVLAVQFILPESKGADTSVELHPIAVTKEFWNVAKNLHFLPFALSGALASAGMFAYISGSPFVFMELFGLSAKQYGWAFGLNAFGLIAASQFSRILLRHFSSEQIVRVVALLQSIIGITLFCGSIWHFLPTVIVLILVWLYMFGQGFIAPNATALALAPFTYNAGTASALTGFLQMMLASAASAFVSYLHNGTGLPMTGVMAGAATLGFLFVLLRDVLLLKKEPATAQ